MSIDKLEPGRYYHVFNRGINRTKIFQEERNYYFFLEKFIKYLGGKVDVHAYCLMPTHFHFLLYILSEILSEDVSEALKGFPTANQPHQTIELLEPVVHSPTRCELTPIEKAFKDFFISYAKAFNKAYDRTGSLFQKKFKRKEVDTDSYYGTVIGYIHLNPVEAKLCHHPSEWKFSSYNGIISNHPTKVKKEEVLAWFYGRQGFIDFHEGYRDYKKAESYLFM